MSERHIPIPQDVLCTTLRPGIVMWSASTKQLVMIELTVPWEERIEDAELLELLARGESRWSERPERQQRKPLSGFGGSEKSDDC